MKNILIILAISLALTQRGWSQAGILQHQIDRIKTANDAHQAEIAGQGGTTPPAPGTPSFSVPQPAMPLVNPEQLKLIEQFVTTLTEFKPGADATPLQVSNLVNSITSLSKIGVKPARELVSKLATNLTAVLKEKALSSKDFRTLGMYVSGVMNSARLTPENVNAIVTRAETLLKTDGISQAATTAFSKSLGAIGTYIQNNKPNLFK